MLVLPTGQGGVLYSPSHFHPIVFNTRFRNITCEHVVFVLTCAIKLSASDIGDDLLLRLSVMVRNVSVVLGCRDPIDTYPGDVGASSCPPADVDALKLAYSTFQESDSRTLVAEIDSAEGETLL